MTPASGLSLAHDVSDIPPLNRDDGWAGPKRVPVVALEAGRDVVFRVMSPGPVVLESGFRFRRAAHASPDCGTTVPHHGAAAGEGHPLTDAFTTALTQRFAAADVLSVVGIMQQAGLEPDPWQRDQPEAARGHSSTAAGRRVNPRWPLRCPSTRPSWTRAASR